MTKPPYLLNDRDSSDGPTPWPVRSVLLLEGERSVIELIRTEIANRSSADVECVRTADDALDMIGYATTPFDLIFLGSAEVRDEGQHIVRVLRRQPIASIVLGFHMRELPPDFPWDAYVGVANWLDLALSGRWTRAVGHAIAEGTSIRRVMDGRRVPVHFDPELASQIYGAMPGERFVPGLGG